MCRRRALSLVLLLSLGGAACSATTVPDASIDDATAKPDAAAVPDAGSPDAAGLDALAPDAADPCATRGGDTDMDGVCDDADLCMAGDDAADADGDLVPDACDLCVGDNRVDADGDMVPDACDMCAGDNRVDADLDMVPDACDRCAGSDDRVDADMDGVPDGCDVCARGDDAIDVDMDTVPDACDACARGDDRIDADLDTVADACDACPGSDDRVDADMDTVPDACDVCATGDDRVDADMDTVPDACDRCALGDDRVDADMDTAADACDVCATGDDRVDPDGDMIPTACDACPADAPNDSDGDTICDSVDLCVGDDRIDDDQDGVPTACDNCPSVPNPTQADLDGVSASTVAFAPEAPGGTSFAAGDDTVSATIAIGFPFRFFGVTYDELVIGSNGFVSFDPAVGSGCCSGRGIPYDDDVDNVIAIGWTDLNPGEGGFISYETRGTAPTRRFVVSYSSVPAFGNGMSPDLTAQAILFEGSNHVIVHTTTQTLANDRIWTRGVESRTGTQAAYLLDQRNNRFAIRRESVLFTTDPEADDIGDDCANSDDEQFEGGSGSGSGGSGSGSGGSGSGGSGSGGSGSGGSGSGGVTVE